MYVWVISRSFPRGNFEWINVKAFELDNFVDCSSNECILEFDLEYAKKLTESHTDYSLVSEKNKFSNYCKKLMDVHNVSKV